MEELDKTMKLIELFREIIVLWRQSMSKVFEGLEVLKKLLSD
ncbi:hypothetical protein [Clostridium sp. DJ247]|nr:hypothetical protein [Clostridium sp. DJ247]